MASRVDVYRRVTGALFILVALLMVMTDRFLLGDHAGPVKFLLYWAICFGCTGMAIMIAALDMFVVRRRSRQQQRELFESTLREIARQKEAAKQSKSPDQPES